MKKNPHDSNIEKCLARFLLHYRSTPHSTTGVSPAELLMKRRLRTHLDLLGPALADRVRKSQGSMMRGNSRMVVFRPLDPVYVRNWSSRPKWLSGKIIEQHGATNVDVALDNGRIIHRHLDHVRKRNPSEMPEDFYLSRHHHRQYPPLQ